MKFDQIEQTASLAYELKAAYEMMEIIQKDGVSVSIEAVLDSSGPDGEGEYRHGRIGIDLATGRALIEGNVQAQIDSLTTRLKMLGVDI